MLKKNAIYVAFFLLLVSNLFAQPFNNEWINYGQKYYKIKIAKDGLYRLDSATIAAAGVPLSTISPRNIQLFHKGKEIFPYIFGEGDDVFNGNDYMLFYAEKNSSRDDSMFYDNVPYLTNPYHSVINDTSAVFLTWNALTSNKRLTLNQDTSFSQSTASPYYWKQIVSPKQPSWSRYINTYCFGPLNYLGLHDPRYKLGEGFYSAELYPTNSYELTFDGSAVYTGGPPAYFTACISGTNDIASVIPDHYIQTYYRDNTSTAVLLDHDSINAYVTIRPTFTLNPSTFGTNVAVGCTSLVDNATGDPNTTNINYLAVWAPHQFNLLNTSEEKIYLPDDGSQAKSKLAISNFNGSRPFLVNVSDSSLHTVVGSAGNYQVLVPNSGKTKLCFLADSLSIVPVSKLWAVNGTGSFIDYQPSIADSNYIIVYHPSLNVNGDVTNYKTYRGSPAGGNYPVITAPITDLYDQFGLGVERSAMAIRKFCAMLIASPLRNPSHLLLMGKSIHPIDCIAGSETQKPPTFYTDKNLVPTWGNPSSDMLITQGLPGSLYLEPAIPTGRLAVETPQELVSYFNKVQLYEQQNDDSLWKKHAIHFIGGSDFWEQQALSSYMNTFKGVFEDTLLGGKVHSFYKTSTAPISVTTNDSVKQLIESGVQVITFFGHGSQAGFDQNIDDPQNYNNSPRFPLIIANSCYTGDIHSADQESHSEVYTLAPNNKGCIGYFAIISTGVANDLFYFNHEFYKQFSSKSYGQTYGAAIRNASRQLMYDQTVLGIYPNDTILKLTCMEMTLHGDPAITPYNFPKPDYGVRNSDVILNTTKYVDSIGVKVIITNYGRAINDSFTVMVQRNFPNGDTVRWYKRVKAPYYQDTLSMFIPKDYYRAVGVNCFYVEVDYLKMISELSETNNSTSGNVCVFVPGSDIEPVWPYKFAIVPNIGNVILKASTADPFAPLTTYRFQVDTNDKFLTPLVNTTVSAPGGVVSLPVTLYNQDSMVYFWRVCKDDTAFNWKETSFQVITGKYGWGQSHFHQFKNDAYQYVVYSDSVPRLFKFVNDVKTITVNDAIADSSDSWNDFKKVQFFYNNAQMRLWTCSRNGWMFAVFDSSTGNLQYSDTLGNPPPWAWTGSNNNCVCEYKLRCTYDFGNYNECGMTSTNFRQDIVNFINSLPNNMYVLAWNTRCWRCPAYEPQTPPWNSQDTVNAAMLNAFHGIGSDLIDSLSNDKLLIIFGRKGMSPGQAHETLSQNFVDEISQKDSILTKYKNGYVASDIIGPCMYSDTAWHSLHWYYRNLSTDVSPATDDTVWVRVVGINALGQKFNLVDFPIDSLNVLDLSQYVNGKQYPYIQLIAYETDDINNTPPQLGKWQVIFDQAPEAAIHPPAGFTVLKSKVEEGEDYKVRLPIKNISDFSFNDSLLVTYYLEDANRVNHPLPYKLKRKPFLPDSVIFDTITVSTLGYAGNNRLWIDVNPNNHVKYQPEQFHFNNVAQIAFDVNRDKINPLLDVTFDGIHILNGDIVSAKPNILIGLKDENRFLALNDTANFKVFVTKPGSSVETRLYFNNELEFIPAQLPHNSCKINYKPVLGQDGVYLLHVYATDRSVNVSGQIDYKIQFEVVNKPSITEVLNYPNPFSTSTKFVFTITGSEIPETFKVQVLTITGRVVKEITREELGFLHIGRNITDYAWDGTDQFGDKLANGVYFYRVETRLNGNEIDHLSTEADGYFKKGFGKMLLMR